MDLRRPPFLIVVVPCFNEADAIDISANQLLSLINEMISKGMVDDRSYLLFVDDGSSDATWEDICRLNQLHKRVAGLRLAHNRGHQYALMAGLMDALKNGCDATVSIDADLQDDPEAIRKMVEEYRSGAEIVFGVRGSRSTDTWFKRSSARAFYRLQKSMGLETVYDHADYRLMSRKALELLAEYGESNLFLRGIIPQLGLPQKEVFYDRKPRVAGESKYPLGKMISFSVDGITSFSSRPLKLIFLTGLVLLLVDIALALYVLSAYLGGKTVAGWTSLMLSVWFLGSLLLMALGIVGVYVGKIYTEVKRRPRYALTESVAPNY